MKTFELKLKTETGRNINYLLGSFDTISQAIEAAKDHRDISSAVSFTVQEQKPSGYTRKTVSSAG